MRLGKGLRGFLGAIGMLFLIGALPLAVAAADPSPVPDSRQVITRLGDQPPAGLPAAVAQSTMLQSFRFTAQGRISAPGEPGDITLAMTGEFAMPDRLHATLKATLHDTNSNDSVGPIELTVVGGKPYVH